MGDAVVDSQADFLFFRRGGVDGRVEGQERLEPVRLFALGDRLPGEVWQEEGPSAITRH